MSSPWIRVPVSHRGSILGELLVEIAIADMIVLRDTVWSTAPSTIVSSHSNGFGSCGAEGSSGFGTGGGSINGWYTPNHPLSDLSMRDYQATGPRSHHTSGAMIRFADRAVRFITERIEREWFHSQWTPQGREVVGEF